MNFLLRFLLSSALGYFIFWYMPGLPLRDQPGTVLAAVVIALIDSFVRPVKVIKRFPITIYSLLLMLTAANVIAIKVCDNFIPGFDVHGWVRMVLCGFFLAAFSLLTDRFMKAD